MVSKRLCWFLEQQALVFTNAQCGFRQHRSTVDHLLTLDTSVRVAFAKSRHVGAVFFDIEAAYDTAWRHGILLKLLRHGIKGSMGIFLKNFLTDRCFKVRVGNCLSDDFTQINGVPQGGVLSVPLFGVMVNDIGDALPQSVGRSLFVDDFAIWLSASSTRYMERQLQLAIATLEKWSMYNGFRFSTSKTVAVHFCHCHYCASATVFRSAACRKRLRLVCSAGTGSLAFAVGSPTVTGVLDTDSGRSMIARHLVMDNLIRPSSEVIHSIGGRELYPVGCADVTVVLHGVSLELTNCLVLDSDMAVVALVVGCDALERHELFLDFTRRSVTGRHADGSQWTLYLTTGDRTSVCAYFARAVPCRAMQDVTVAPGDSVTLSCTVSSQSTCALRGPSPRSYVFTGGVSSAPCLQPVDGVVDISETRVLVCNRGFVPATIRKGAPVGQLHTAADSTLDCNVPVDVLTASSDTTNEQPRRPLTRYWVSHVTSETLCRRSSIGIRRCLRVMTPTLGSRDLL